MSEVGGESFALIEPVLARQGVHLDARRRDGVVRFAELIAHWNRGINLVGNVERLYSRHLLDCLMLATLPWPVGAVEIVDVGAGAGLPGIVVALLHPECRVHGLETVAKKVTFQQVAASALELDNYLPRRQDAHRHARSPDGRGRYDVVLARAFAGLESLLDVIAAPPIRRTLGHEGAQAGSGTGGAAPADVGSLRAGARGVPLRCAGVGRGRRDRRLPPCNGLDKALLRFDQHVDAAVERALLRRVVAEARAEFGESEHRHPVALDALPL